MKIYEYSNDDQYRQEQYKANKEKEGRHWISILDVLFIKESMPFDDVKSILCHGTRNGTELRLFSEHFPDARVLGTEIAPTALKYENTIRHDFRRQHDRLIGKFDIVFSNSFDHTNEPRETLMVWKDQLNKRGIMFVEAVFDKNNISTASDPLEWDHEDEFTDLARSIGFKIRKTYSNYNNQDNLTNRLYMLVQ